MPRVALFATCAADLCFPDTAVAAVRLLEAAGCEVEFPEAQTCCGQPALTAGEPEAAARLAAHFLDTFRGYEAVVSPSGSCAATVRHWYGRLLPHRDTEVADLAVRTFELTQYLVDVVGRVDLGARFAGVANRVSVHDACHGLRHQGVGDAPRRLLAAAGATLVEMAEPETCCGFGGIFAARHGALAGALADHKLGLAAATEADWVASCDALCVAHLEGRRRRTGQGPRPVHVADLLASGLP